MTTVEQYIKNYNTDSYIRKNMRERDIRRLYCGCLEFN